MEGEEVPPQCPWGCGLQPTSKRTLAETSSSNYHQVGKTLADLAGNSAAPKTSVCTIINVTRITEILFSVAEGGRVPPGFFFQIFILCCIIANI